MYLHPVPPPFLMMVGNGIVIVIVPHYQNNICKEGGVVNITFAEIQKDAENRRVLNFILQAIVCLDICIPPSPDSLALQLLVLQLVKHI